MNWNQWVNEIFKSISENDSVALTSTPILRYPIKLPQAKYLLQATESWRNQIHLYVHFDKDGREIGSQHTPRVQDFQRRGSFQVSICQCKPFFQLKVDVPPGPVSGTLPSMKYVSCP